MVNAVLFKLMQKKYKFRNPNNVTLIPDDFTYTRSEYQKSLEYLENLKRHNINYTFPGHHDYPQVFYKIKEPPLFFEYIGKPLWNKFQFLAVVGSRQIHNLTENWLREHLDKFVCSNNIGIVSGGANGVDQFAHLIALKNSKPTVFVLPSGLLNFYPKNLEMIRSDFINDNVCFVSEFEIDQKIHKAHFYYRNRLIAAFGTATLVAQATLKSGSLLTVHHCLEMGRPIITIPAHPEIIGFEGNLKLLSEGAGFVTNSSDLHDFWKAENWTG